VNAVDGHAEASTAGQPHADPDASTDAPADDDAFGDVLRANAGYARTFSLQGLPPRAGRGLAVVTCMDSRIEPLAMLGLRPGDAKVLRNAGARVTDDVLRALVLAVHLLGVTRVLVVPHTACRMAQPSDDDVHELIRAASGVDTRGLQFGTTPDQESALREDITRITAHPMLPHDLAVVGCMYDVATGALTRIV
jgi:carbonic anhydrase